MLLPSAMLRTCAVRLLAIWFTESVRSFHTTAHTFYCGLPTQLAFCTHFQRHTRYPSIEKRFSCFTMSFTSFAIQGKLALQYVITYLQWHLLGEIALGHRADNTCYFDGRMHKVRYQCIQRIYAAAP